MAAKLYNNGAGYQLAAVNTGGYLYLLANDETITNFSDLMGKVVKIAGEHSVSDVVFRHLLIQNGIKPDEDLTLEYNTSVEELEKDIINGKDDLMVLPEPWVSDLLSKNSGFNIALDIQDEWKRINGTETPVPQTCLIVKKEIPSQKTEAWSFFIDDYKDSINWVNSNPDKTTELLDSHDIGVPRGIAEEVMSRCYLVYLDALSAKPVIEKYLKIFLELSPESIGGKIPDIDFYYKK